jgi:hypothetical protein
MIAGVDEEGSKNIQDPFKAGDHRYPHGDEYHPEKNGHKNTDEQYPADEFLLDRKSRKDDDEDEDVVNTKTPFHEVGAQVFQCYGLTLLDPHKKKESQCQAHPEKGLQQGFTDRDRGILFTEQPKVKGQGSNQHKAKD